MITSWRYSNKENMVGYQFDNMLVSPRVDAKTYFSLMGDIFYRQINSSRGGTFTNYDQNGYWRIDMLPSTHIVAGRMVEIYDKISNIRVDSGQYLAFYINLVNINIPSGEPFTRSYNVENNQLELVVVDEKLTQNMYNNMKQEYANNPLIEEIIVPIYSPDMVLDIESPQGYSQAVESDFESYQHIVGSSVSSQLSYHTSYMQNWNSITISNAESSMISTNSSMKSSMISTNSSMHSNISSSLNSQFSSLESNTYSQLSSGLSSGSSFISQYAKDVKNDVSEHAQSIFKEEADKVVDPYISYHVSSYLSVNELEGVGFLSEDEFFTNNDGEVSPAFTKVMSFDGYIKTGWENGKTTILTKTPVRYDELEIVSGNDTEASLPLFTIRYNNKTMTGFMMPNEMRNFFSQINFDVGTVVGFYEIGEIGEQVDEMVYHSAIGISDSQFAYSSFRVNEVTNGLITTFSNNLKCFNYDFKYESFNNVMYGRLASYISVLTNAYGGLISGHSQGALKLQLKTNYNKSKVNIDGKVVGQMNNIKSYNQLTNRNNGVMEIVGNRNYLIVRGLTIYKNDPSYRHLYVYGTSSYSANYSLPNLSYNFEDEPQVQVFKDIPTTTQGVKCNVIVTLKNDVTYKPSDSTTPTCIHYQVEYINDSGYDIENIDVELSLPDIDLDWFSQ